MATVAHSRKIYVKSTNAAPAGSDEVDGVTDVSGSLSKTMHDTTDLKDTSGAHTRMSGLEDATFSLSCQFEQSDAPQALIRSSYESGATIYLTDLPDGTNGYTFPCLVESIDHSGAVDGVNEVSYSFVLNGAKISRP